MVKNVTKEYSRYVFDVAVTYREDVDEVIPTACVNMKQRLGDEK